MDADDSALLSAIGSLASALIALGALAAAVLATRANKASATAAARSVDLAERIFSMSLQVRWKVVSGEPDSSAYLLTNIGGSVAYRVEISGAAEMADRTSVKLSIGPDEAIKIYSEITYDSEEFDLVVTWYDDPDRSGVPHTWKHTLA